MRSANRSPQHLNRYGIERRGDRREWMRNRRDRRDRRDRRGSFQHPRKRETKPRERETVDVNENTERDQWSEKARARLKEARKIGTGRDRHFFEFKKKNVRATADMKHNTGLRAECNRSAPKVNARPVRQNEARRGGRVSAARTLRAQDHSAAHRIAESCV